MKPRGDNAHTRIYIIWCFVAYVKLYPTTQNIIIKFRVKPGGAKNKAFATKIGDEVRVNYRVKGNQVKETTGIVSEMSKNGYVRLCTCRRWLTVVRNLRSVEKHGGFKEMTSKKDKFHGISDW